MKNYLKQIKDNGGNTVRIWVHTEGDRNPSFDGSGNVTGTDPSGTLVADMKKYALAAQDMDMMVIFTFWNGAVLRNQKTISMLNDDSKYGTWLNNALRPIVSGLKGIPSVVGWEIFNEPELSVTPGQYDSDACHDTNRLSGTGAGNTGHFFSMRQI